MRSHIPVLAAGLLAVVASGCNYGSSMEAEAACRQWWSEGGQATFKDEYYGVHRERSLRFCVDEDKTSQWLGVSRPDVKPGDVLPQDEIPRKEVVKRFRYPSR